MIQKKLEKTNAKCHMLKITKRIANFSLSLIYIRIEMNNLSESRSTLS